MPEAAWDLDRDNFERDVVLHVLIRQGRYSAKRDSCNSQGQLPRLNF